VRIGLKGLRVGGFGIAADVLSMNRWVVVFWIDGNFILLAACCLRCLHCLRGLQFVLWMKEF
jgi:hypothetical protein